MPVYSTPRFDNHPAAGGEVQSTSPADDHLTLLLAHFFIN